MSVPIVSSPALERLYWLVDGLAGRWRSQTDATPVLAPGFAAVVDPSRFVTVMQDRAVLLDPIVVTGIEVEGWCATARFETRDGGRWLAQVMVEEEPPHRIVSGYAQPWVPEYLSAALPLDFAAADFAGAAETGGAMLMVFAGVPGSGKSAVADQVGRALGVSVFALDWLLGALTPFGMRHRLDLIGVGEELLTTLAYRELAAGRSAILDTTSEDEPTRARWQSLAAAAGAVFQPVVCVCSDLGLHRERVEHRRRGIPGWADAGEWRNVTSRLASFPPWPEVMLIDTTAPLDQCVTEVLHRLPAREATATNVTARLRRSLSGSRDRLRGRRVTRARTVQEAP